MINYVTLLTGGDSQSLHKMGSSRDSAFEGTKTEADEDTLKLLMIMSHDLRSSLLSMLATLKLLNRGYYGRMDKEAAQKIQDLLSNATRLSDLAEECLGRTFAMIEGLEMGARNK